MKVWQVVTEEAPWFFRYPARAGSQVQPPYPLNLPQFLPPAAETAGVSGPYWRDRKSFFWAKAAGDDGGAAQIVIRYFYPMQPGFYFPGTNPPPPGADVPLLDLAAGTPGTPIDVHYDVTWPATAPELRIADTLVKPKFGLPDIHLQKSVEIVYQQSVALGTGTSVKLIDPTREYAVDLATLPVALNRPEAVEGALTYFLTLPPQLRSRIYYDRISHKLKIKGQFVDAGGEPYLLLNVITEREKQILLSLSGDVPFQSAVNALAATTANVTEVPPDGDADSMALTAGLAQGTGYVTLAFANKAKLNETDPNAPITLAIIKVSCPPYRGEVKELKSANPFDEKLTLRHSGDFAGKADSYIFEWQTRPDDGSDPNNDTGWFSFTPAPATGQGAVDITIAGPGIFTVSDNFFRCRYRPLSPPLCPTASNPAGWSDWTPPSLGEGWIKRVLAGIDPFEQRIQSYQNNQVNKIVSMISQAGPPYQGSVALNQQAANSFGLLEIYETVLRRGKSLSIEGVPPVNYQSANNALLLAAGRLADLYMLLGNEAYADAADPTIAFGTDDHVYGAEASSIHCFMNQTASLMEEELDLLRGRDNSKFPSVTVAPHYNRLVWNFTRDITGGEVAYALNYNIRSQDGGVPGTISEADAAALYPQGHGDAWGHYLSAIKNYYRLLRNPNFVWVARAETINLGGADMVEVDYQDERKFAAAAAARARTGAEIVNLTYRNAYVEDPAGQWQGYQDAQKARAWGLAEWGSRAGQGAFFDWVVGNALLPDVDTNSAHSGIAKIDRTTVTELREVASAFIDIQTKVAMADSGLNPLSISIPLRFPSGKPTSSRFMSALLQR